MAVAAAAVVAVASVGWWVAAVSDMAGIPCNSQMHSSRLVPHLLGTKSRRKVATSAGGVATAAGEACLGKMGANSEAKGMVGGWMAGVVVARAKEGVAEVAAHAEWAGGKVE